MNSKIKELIKDKKVVLMDFDGTIVDTEPLNYITWCRCMSKFNLHFDFEIFKKIIGYPVDQIAEILEKIYNQKISKEEFMKGVPFFVQTFKEVEKEKGIKVLDYVNVLIEDYKDIPKYVVSNQSKELINMTLSKYGLSDKFVGIISCMEEKVNKIDIYNNTLKYFGCLSNECLLCEDAQKYIDAGKALGMSTIGIKHCYNNISADYVIEIDDIHEYKVQ